jgi:asparagine synthase (glutamine-hydrolysing)
VSGIAGIYNLDGQPVTPIDLQRMARAIPHRGPDGIGYWLGNSVGFAHLKLQTTAESASENQPLRNDHLDLCLIMDGRIDNRTELLVELEDKGFLGCDATDAELVLRSYACWGEDSPRRLLGDFAFAIWDARRKQLFCARDHVGVRPFYYHCTDSRFIFGSEIRAILAPPDIPRRLNESRVVDFLVEELERDDRESTFYKDILRLPAGHLLIVGPNRFTKRDYWNLKASPQLNLGSIQEYGDAFREVFLKAVGCRLRSSHRVGSTLSGGLDSSSVACTIRDKLGSELKEPLHTISLVDADESKCGETPFIKEVLSGGGLVPHIIRSNDVSDLRGEMAHSDEPFEIASYFSNWFGFAAASKAGLRVLLDGVSGDHIIPPYEYLAILVRSLDWSTLSAELAWAARKSKKSRFRILARYGLVPLMPSLYRSFHWLSGNSPTSPTGSSALINVDFAIRMRVAERIKVQRREWLKAAQDLGNLHSLSFSGGVLSFFLEHAGRIAASMGVETRHPFLDRRVIDFFLSLPLKMKSHVPLPKMVIREGMKGILPDRVRLRTCYAHPGAAFLGSLLPKRKALRPLEWQTLASAREYVNVDYGSRCWESFDSAGRIDDAWQAWVWLTLALWMDQKQLRA